MIATMAIQVAPAFTIIEIETDRPSWITCVSELILESKSPVLASSKNAVSSVINLEKRSFLT